jgi:RNA polymerase sigma-70 factor, ECF subfamily
MSARSAAGPASSLAAVPVPPELPEMPQVPALSGMAHGDPGAADRLWSLYAHRIRALGLNLSGYDPTFADDLVQETFSRLWRSAGRYDQARGSEPTFVFTVARRAAVDLWRRGRRAANDESLDLTQTAGRIERVSAARRGEDEGLDAVLTGWVVTEVLDALSPSQRQVIDLAYFGQLSQSEIAQRLEIPLGTVKTRTFAALKVLRRALADRGVLP